MQTIAEKWMIKGKIEKALEDAKKMLVKGFDPKIIMEITGVNREDIEKLAATSH